MLHRIYFTKSDTSFAPIRGICEVSILKIRNPHSPHTIGNLKVKQIVEGFIYNFNQISYVLQHMKVGIRIEDDIFESDDRCDITLISPSILSSDLFLYIESKQFIAENKIEIL